MIEEFYKYRGVIWKFGLTFAQIKNDLIHFYFFLQIFVFAVETNFYIYLI